MQTFREKKLLFDFPDAWQVAHYDRKANRETGAPAGFYRRVVTGGEVKHVQAVDFICRVPGPSSRLQLLEVKDDRLDTRAEGERRTQLCEAVLSKVIGTLAGLVLAERLGVQMDDESMQPMTCLSTQPVLEVVLFWLEPPIEGSALRRYVKKDGKAELHRRINAKLKQWQIPFALYNLTDTDRLPPDWQVREVPPIS